MKPKPTSSKRRGVGSRTRGQMAKQMEEPAAMETEGRFRFSSFQENAGRGPNDTVIPPEAVKSEADVKPEVDDAGNVVINQGMQIEEDVIVHIVTEEVDIPADPPGFHLGRTLPDLEIENKSRREVNESLSVDRKALRNENRTLKKTVEELRLEIQTSKLNDSTSHQHQSETSTQGPPPKRVRTTEVIDKPERRNLPSERKGNRK